MIKLTINSLLKNKIDTQISSKDQEIRGDQPPSELPTLSEKDKSQESSDHIPLQKAKTRHTLTTEPFQPILKALADLERDDPKFAFPAAHLLGSVDDYGSHACPSTWMVRSYSRATLS
ncbi:unnamed protein product [Penicillium camemberti]|uniref:Str. FM013 n=1 Tax=Penicillium camemberti (strain FM 013) TaxID=1429867 RepID=A0A0G4PXA1_PENC3|nr:unnamed protein product [Penicillium camemberti]